jgi:hypothetical protein
MKEFLRSLIPDFAKKILYDISKWALLLSLPTLLVGVLIFFAYFPFTFLSGLLLGFILGGIFWLLILLIISSFNKPGIADEIIIDPDYKILDLAVVYRHISRTQLKYERKVKLEILRDNVDRYVGKYNWTGTGEQKISVKDHAQELIKTRRKEMYQIFEVKFPKAMSKGEIVVVEIEMELDDSNKSAVPVLSQTITELVDQTMLKVIFPNDVQVAKNIIKSEYSHASARKTLMSTKEEINYNEFTWIIAKPILYHRYMLQWTWKE